MYAKFFFELHRFPAYKKMAYSHILEDFKLFCIYKGEVYRVTGRSRMGHIWLTKDFSKSLGYDVVTWVNECTGWSKHLLWLKKDKFKQRLYLLLKDLLFLNKEKT